MKTAFILLLGFTGLLPATCSNSKSEKQSHSSQPAQIDTGSLKTDIALYGPVIMVKNPQRSA